MVWVLIAFIAISTSIAMQWLPDQYRFNSGDEWLRDRFTQLQSNDVEENRFVLIDIDESSIANLGAWPWKRTMVADMLETLISDYSASGVALDIFFPKSGDEIGDLRLASLAEFAPVVFSQSFDFKHDRPIPWEYGSLSGAYLPNDSIHQLAMPNLLAKASGYIANHPGLVNGKHTGNIGFVPDNDGTLRRIPAFIEYKKQVYIPLALSLFQCCAIASNQKVLAKQILDVDSKGFARVPFYKKLSAYKVISASQIIERKIPLQWLQNKLVIIGSSSLSLADRVATPLNASTSGFLVHAEILSTLLDEQAGINYTQLPGKWLAIFFTFCVIALGIYALEKYSAMFNAFLLACATIIWLTLSFFLVRHDMWFSPMGPLLSNFFLLAVAVPFAWQSSQNKSKHLLDTLNQYVAKSVVKELLRRDIVNPLAPRQLYVTTLIADMVSYTQHVENLSMEDAANLTRDFLECLTEPVLNNGGTLDKYTGDGLVAFWGAPLPVENHADLALDAAILIVKNVQLFNQRCQTEGKKAVNVRIGIESGLAIAGDFGSSQRSIYTAVGDSVNTASRLEDAGRHYDYDIILGKGTVECSSRHKFHLVGERMLKGKEKATLLYTVEIPT